MGCNHHAVKALLYLSKSVFEFNSVSLSFLEWWAGSILLRTTVLCITKYYPYPCSLLLTMQVVGFGQKDLMCHPYNFRRLCSIIVRVACINGGAYVYSHVLCLNCALMYNEQSNRNVFLIKIAQVPCNINPALTWCAVQSAYCNQIRRT